jgi:DNA-binding NarL/FixJ family response regulator
MTPIRLLVVDDHALFRTGLISLIAAMGKKRLIC